MRLLTALCERNFFEQLSVSIGQRRFDANFTQAITHLIDHQLINRTLNQITQNQQGAVFVVLDLGKLVGWHAAQYVQDGGQRQTRHICQLTDKLPKCVHRMRADKILATGTSRLVHEFHIGGAGHANRQREDIKIPRNTL